MNLPNKLTILRVCMIPFFVAALLYHGGESQVMRLLADAIFITVSYTHLDVYKRQLMVLLGLTGEPGD